MDITKCKADGCLLAFNCRRFTAESSELQSYFTDAPYRVINGKTECAYQWNINENEYGERGISEANIGGIEEAEQGNGEETESDSE